MKRDFKKRTYLARTGFALVEVILATAIVSGGLLMVVRVFPLGLRIEQKVERYSTATVLGRAMIEDIKRKGYDSLSEVFPEVAKDCGIGKGKFEEYQGYGYEVEWQDTETPNLRKVRVRILHEEPGPQDKNNSRQYLELVTYLARYN